MKTHILGAVLVSTDQIKDYKWDRKMPVVARMSSVGWKLGFSAFNYRNYPRGDPWDILGMACWTTSPIRCLLYHQRRCKIATENGVDIFKPKHLLVKEPAEHKTLHIIAEYLNSISIWYFHILHCSNLQIHLIQRSGLSVNFCHTALILHSVNLVRSCS